MDRPRRRLANGCLQPIIDEIFSQARAEGRHEPVEAYAFDALMKLADEDDAAPRSRTGTTKVLVRVDLETLVRGHPSEGEVCEIAGFGPVPVRVVEEILAQGDTFLAAVLTTAQRVTGVAHLGRRPTAKQVSGLQWLYPTCAVEGWGLVEGVGKRAFVAPDDPRHPKNKPKTTERPSPEKAA